VQLIGFIIGVFHGTRSPERQNKRLRFKIFYRLSACIRFANELFRKLFIISVANKIDYRLNMDINLNAARYGQLAIVLKHCLNKYNRCFTGF